VLVCRASQSEGALSFLGLCDLFETVPDELVDALPEPQRLALEAALLRSVGRDSPDRVGMVRAPSACFGRRRPRRRPWWRSTTLSGSMNLSRAYAKLGIRSRVQLASRLSEAGKS
jgi:hypothetical protein